MKINSNTVTLEPKEYEKLEKVVSKIASENGIDNVEGIQIHISQEEGVVVFKQSEENKE